MLNTGMELDNIYVMVKLPGETAVVEEGGKVFEEVDLG